MDDFLAKFYPDVLAHKLNAHEDNYCKYRNQVFQLFSSCLYLSALVATFLASEVTKKFGRTRTMLIAGLFYIAGTAMGSAAQNLGMLLTGRIFLGCGLGFANQAVPLYLSEIAPPKSRGGLNYLFVVYVTIGIFSGNIVNYITSNIHPWGWRLSLAIAGVPSIILTVSGLILVETPASLIQRGYYDQAKAVLRRVRGFDDIDTEYEDILKASEVSTGARNQFRTLLKRGNRPQLVMAFAFPFFQQVAGNDAILFYGPFLFKTAGFGDKAALYSAVITGATGFLAACVAVFLVDKVGRKKLLLSSAVVMISAMVVMTAIFAAGLPGNTQTLPRAEGIVEVVMVCLFVIAFSGSLGPLAWLIPSEIFPLEIRSAGLSFTVFINMLFKFLIAQTFLSMLCAFKYGTFLFFGGWGLVMSVFVVLLVPETKGIPIDDMTEVWRSHWFWSKVIPSDTEQIEELAKAKP